MSFLLLLIIPVLFAVGLFLFTKNKISLKEFIIHLSVQALISVVSVFMIYNQNTGDSEVWAGKLVDKQRLKVRCSHSYSCNCRTVRSCSGGKTRSCSSRTVCSTCYRHSYDVSWALYSSIGSSLNVSRLDSRGLEEPPRWSRAKIGEPWFENRSYTNYVKGAANTLFKHKGQSKSLLKKIPEYPNRIYDYHRLDRAVNIKGSSINLSEFNNKLQKLNSRLGKTKQAVALVVFSKNESTDLSYAIKQKWIGGKKNDVIIIIDHDGQGNINWSEIISWSKSTYINTVLKDSIELQKKLDFDKILGIIEKEITSHFQRKSMEDFEYLKYDVEPTSEQLIWALIVGLLISLGLGYFFYKNDI